MVTIAPSNMLRDILLVEDNPGDVALTRTAFDDARLANPLAVVTDGEAAVRLLKGRAERGEDLPCMIVLDLNLPRLDGREVLAVIKEDPRLRHIPVVVLSSSSAERDIVESYELGVNAYVTKPVGIDDFLAAVRHIGDFWFGVVTLPPDRR